MADFSAYPPTTPMAADMPAAGERHPNADLTTASVGPDMASAAPGPTVTPTTQAAPTLKDPSAGSFGGPLGGMSGGITGGMPGGITGGMPGGMLGGITGGMSGGKSQGPTFLGFGLPIPGFLMEAAAKLGFVWPQSDEMQLFAIGRNYISSGIEFNQLRADVNDAVSELLESNESDGLAAFERFQKRLSSMAGSHMMVSGLAAPALGIAYLAAGALVLAYKVHAIMILIEAAILFASQAFGALLGPLGLGAIAAKIAALRVQLMSALKAVKFGMSKVLDVAARIVEMYTKVATPILQNRPARKLGNSAVPMQQSPQLSGPSSPHEASPAGSSTPWPTAGMAPASAPGIDVGAEPMDDAGTRPVDTPPGTYPGGVDPYSDAPVETEVSESAEEPESAWDDVIDSAAGGGAATVAPAPPTPPETSALNPEMARG